MKADNDHNTGEMPFKELVLTLVEWFRYFMSKWVLILILGLLGSAAGLRYAFSKKVIYQAELSFALEDDKSSGGGGLGTAMGLASQFGIDLGGGGGGAFSGDNLLTLMKSRSMVEKALLTSVDVYGKRETLVELYISFNQIREKWDKDPVLKTIRFLPNADRSKFNLKQDSVLGLFCQGIVKSNLSVEKVDKKLSIITVKVKSYNELFSKYFAEALTKTVSDFYIATKTKKSVQNVSILQHQADSVRRELNSALTGVASSADGNPNANPALQILRVPSQRRQVDVQANQAILTQLVSNLEISKVALRKETPLIQLIDVPILPLDKIKVGKLSSMIMGGLIGGFLALAYLVLRRVYNSIFKK